MPKPNPILEAYARKLEAEHVMKRNMLSEIDMMAAMLAAHDMLQVGPGRAAAFMHEYAMKKKEIAEVLVSDVGVKGKGDPEFLKTRHDLAIALKEIFGAENWKEARTMFPMLVDFWEV